MSEAKFKVGDKVKDLHEGGIHEIRYAEFDTKDEIWYYSFGPKGWFWVPENDLDWENENEKD